MVKEQYKKLYSSLKEVIPSKRVFSDQIQRLAFGTDASVYRLIPELVVRVENEDEMRAVMQRCRKHRIPYTFKAGGTSLSGQTLTDSVLLELGPSWRNFEVKDNGELASFQCGVIGEDANRALSSYHRKIGPAPASIKSAKIGGIVANNASGTSYGIISNSYNTISGGRIIFTDGSLLDTRDESSRAEFEKSHKQMLESLKELSLQAKNNPEIADTIRAKYQLKNTTGYGVNSLLDFEDPIDMILHLMVGSEGTLAFISEVEFKTLKKDNITATAMIYFADITQACDAAFELRQQKVSAAELMDRAALRAVQDLDGMPEVLKTLDDKAVALLIESSADSQAEVDSQVEEISQALKKYKILEELRFTQDIEEYNKLWKVRKGLFTSASATRRKGTQVIIEDIAVPGEKLGQALTDLQEMFGRFGYDDSIIWGHALDGNVHFVLMQDFSSESELENYRKFIYELVDNILNKYHGSLKAEHGTGRNMAPFVEQEWGAEIYGIMKEIKKIFDPDNILNPGVLLNNDPDIFTKNLKQLHPADKLVDNCIECGFCEVSCVSKDLTLSPRHRIVVYRRMAYLRDTGESPYELAELMRDYDYYGDKTCATDGLCELSCPVNINTGNLVKKLRSQNLKVRNIKIADFIAGHMALLQNIARPSLNLLHFFHKIFGSAFMRLSSRLVRLLSFKTVPYWSPAMPKAAARLNIKKKNMQSDLKVVYFPSCINRSMGAAKAYEEEVSLVEKTVSLLTKAGYEILYPKKMNSLCCGMPYLSKGYKETGLAKSNELEQALLLASEQGKYPILVDMSPCLYTMKENMQESLLNLYDPIEFTLKFLRDRLEFHPIEESISVFPVCSAKKMGLDSSLVELAKLCASDVLVSEANCCGFAGDRGFNYPELNAHGLRYIREQHESHNVQQGYSNSRTCEIGLSEHSGVNYQSIFFLVDKVTRAKEPKDSR